MKQAVSVVDHYNISEQTLYADFVASGDSESGALAEVFEAYSNHLRQ